MRFAFKYRLYPIKAQSAFLNGELRQACSRYNAALQERIGAYKTCGQSLNYYDQAKQLKAMRRDGRLTLANFSCCRDVLRRLDKPFQAFFRPMRVGVSSFRFPLTKRKRLVDGLREEIPGERRSNAPAGRAPPKRSGTASITALLAACLLRGIRSAHK